MRSNEIMKNGEQINSRRNDYIIHRKTVRIPPWLITYSDLITLLLTFFILLLSMADLDPQRFNEASKSLKGALGLQPRSTSSQVIEPVFPSAPATNDRNSEIGSLTSFYQKLRQELEQSLSIEEGLRTLQPDATTLVVRLDESLLFAQGSDTLLSTAIPVLKKIGRAVKPYPIDIRIEGHSDAVEATADQRSNSWELSTSRAVSVLRYFVQERMIPIERLSAVGYGAQRPVVKNTTAANRRLNRRVDLLLQTKFSSGTTPAEKASPRFPL
jgi:chemotaxis protein MotB